ncbi:melanocyte-stimulating hormone receptor-like [Oculina patagonica]
MNSSLHTQTGTTPLECSVYDFIGGVPERFSTPAYSVIVFNIIILVVTCPFTIVLNVLTMIAVKVKARLQSMSNIALACLAATDAMVGIFVQPLYISFVITTLQGETTSDACPLQNVAKYSMNFFSFSSLVHLVLMSADRYLAIKQSYSYEHIVTKARVLVASAIAWIFTTVVLILYFIDRDIFLLIQNSFVVIFMVLIAISSVVVYGEARRHERQIAAQQVSVEAREKFLKEKRVLKLTTTIVVSVFSNYLPIISFRIIKNVLKDRVSIDTIYAVYFSAGSLVLVNSFINPLIYSVRLRQFRVAFIELLLKKNHAEAEQVEKKMFGSLINAAPNVVTNQGGETEEENVNQVNASIDIETSQGGERVEQNVS